MSEQPQNTPQNAEAPADVNKLIAERRQKLAELRAAEKIAFPNDFRRDAVAADLHKAFGEKDNETLEASRHYFALAGRIMLKRIMGKASFSTIQDMSGRIQLYISKEAVGEDTYNSFKKWDMGDIVGARGYVFRTRTGELSLHVEELRLLTKSLRPLPDKFHGIADQELKYRQRYVDLIMSEDTRRAFIVRSQVVEGIRRFMSGRGFMEVETPMMHMIPGAPPPGPSRRITMRWTCRSFCASRPSFISSVSSWAVSSACSRSTATFATRAFPRGTIPNSP